MLQGKFLSILIDFPFYRLFKRMTVMLGASLTGVLLRGLVRYFCLIFLGMWLLVIGREVRVYIGSASG